MRKGMVVLKFVEVVLSIDGITIVGIFASWIVAFGFTLYVLGVSLNYVSKDRYNDGIEQTAEILNDIAMRLDDETSN